MTSVPTQTTEETDGDGNFGASIFNVLMEDVTSFVSIKVFFSKIKVMFVGFRAVVHCALQVFSAV